MDLKTAKARGDYRFILNGVEHPQVLTDLRKGSMDSLSGTAEPYIGAAVLEVGYLDIELNIFFKSPGNYPWGKSPGSLAGPGLFRLRER